MLFLVTIEVNIPRDADPQLVARLQAAERERAQELQHAGKWRHLWRVAGRYASVSVFDVGSVDELHDLLWNLPLFSYLDVDVTPLATHPSAVGP